MKVDSKFIFVVRIFLDSRLASWTYLKYEGGIGRQGGSHYYQLEADGCEFCYKRNV